MSTDVLDDEAVGISLVDPTKQDADGEAGPLDEPSTSHRRRRRKPLGDRGMNDDDEVTIPE